MASSPAATPRARADTAVAAGTPIPGVPRTSAYAALRWGGELGWHARVDGRHVGAVPVNNVDGEQADRYTVFGASAGYGFRAARSEGRLYLGVENLTDRAYAGSVIVNESNRRYFEPAPDRTLVAGIELRWRD